MKRARKNFWLVNKAPARKRRRSITARRPTKRRPPMGFRTWKAYMDSIRPTSKGGSVARRRRRRRSTAATSSRRRRPRRRRNPATVTTAVANPRRRRRRNVAAFANRRRRRSVIRRRNPSFSVRGIIREMKDAGMLAGQVVAGKAITRIVRSRVIGADKKGTLVQVGAELGIATLLGYGAGMAFGPRVGANVMAGGYVGAIESLIHQISALKVVSDAISDDGNPTTMVVPAAAASQVAGYVDSLGGYVPPSLQGLGDVGDVGRDVTELQYAGV